MQSVQNSQKLTCNHRHNKLLIRLIRICLMSWTLLVVGGKNAYTAEVQRWDNPRRFKRSALLRTLNWKHVKGQHKQHISIRRLTYSRAPELQWFISALTGMQSTTTHLQSRARCGHAAKLCSELRMHTLQLHSSNAENNTITDPENIM